MILNRFFMVSVPQSRTPCYEEVRRSEKIQRCGAALRTMLPEAVCETLDFDEPLMMGTIVGGFRVSTQEMVEFTRK